MASRTGSHFCQAPNLQSELSEPFEWILTELSFNMIEILLCLGFISLYLWFCYVIFTRSILSTPACDVLLYVRLKTNERVKYFQHEKRNFVSPSDHVIFVLLHKIHPIQQILFSVGRLLGFDISPASLSLSVCRREGWNVRSNLATNCL